MDKILNRICGIEEHPISFFDKKNALIYVNALGACLCAITQDSPIARMYYNVWAQSIMKDGEDYASLYWREDPKRLKAAMRLRLGRFKILSMRYEFIFDFYYLVSSSLPGRIDFAEIREFALKHICNNYLTRKILTRIHNYYIAYSDCPGRIAEALIRHKEENDRLLSEKEKRILVVANMSAGKSTLINALIGHKLNLTRTTACTNKIVSLNNKKSKDGATLRMDKKYIYLNKLESINSGLFDSIALPFCSLLSDQSICIVDTPGINNIHDFHHREITENEISLGNYDVVLYVSNGRYFGTNDERVLLELLKKKVSKPIIFVLNQLDAFKQKEDSIAKMMSDFKSDLIKIGFKDPIICPLSAYAAFLFRMSKDSLDEDERDEREILCRKFERDYYNLPGYVSETSQNSELERTGILNLEKIIKSKITNIK